MWGCFLCDGELHCLCEGEECCLCEGGGVVYCVQLCCRLTPRAHAEVMLYHLCRSRQEQQVIDTR